MTTLHPVTIKIEAELNNFKTVVRNEEAIDSSIDNLFSFLKNQITVKTEGDETAVLEKKVEEQKEETVEYLVDIVHGEQAQEAMKKTFDGATDVTGVYEKEKNMSRLLLWEEGDSLLLWNTGASVTPVVKCLEFYTDGTEKGVKLYSTKEVYNDANKNVNVYKDYIKDKNETIISPSGNVYYIVGQSYGPVDAEPWSYSAPYISLGLIVDNGNINGWGFNLPEAKGDFGLNITEKDVETKTTYEVGKIVTDNSTDSNEKITATDSEELEEIENTGELSVLKEKIKKQIKDNYISRNTLVLYSKQAEESNELTNALDNLKQLLDQLMKAYDENGKIYEDYNELPDDLKKLTDTSKLNDFLNNLGIDDDATDEEIQDIAEDAAHELINALNGNDTDNELANTIMDSVNNELSNAGENESGDGDIDGDGKRKNKKKHRIGLWYAIYKVLEFSANGIMGIQDFQSIIYSTGMATVIGAYFSECMHIAIHLGGTCIAGVGVSVLCMSLQNIPKGFKTIQNGTKTTDLMTQCQSIADGFSDMIANGIITSIVAGMMVAAPSPVPFVGVGKANNNMHASVKILILVAALASAILLNTAAVVAVAVGSTVTDASAKALGQIISKIESLLKEKINKVEEIVRQNTVNKFDSVLNNTALSAKEKAEKIIEDTEDKILSNLDGLKSQINGEVEKLSNSIALSLSRLKQNSLVLRFGKNHLKKLDEIANKVKEELPKKTSEAIDDGLEKAKDIVNKKGKELTEQEIEEILKKAKIIDESYDKIEGLANKIAVKKVNTLISILKTISSMVSKVIGLNAEDIYEKILKIGTTFQDANDFTAMLLSAATKASILLTLAQSTDTVTGSIGTGLLLPVGP